MGPNDVTQPEGESPTKDQFYERLAILADEMIVAYGKDFTIGSLILAARFIAEGKALRKTTLSEKQP
jgi:hypothetical protein